MHLKSPLPPQHGRALKMAQVPHDATEADRVWTQQTGIASYPQRMASANE